MTIPTILMMIGILIMAASFIFKRKSTDIDYKIEELSIAMHEQLHHVQQRLRKLEEEMLMPPTPLPRKHPQRAQPTTRSTTKEPIHAIIINQILALHQQGYNVHEIAVRASLTEEEVIDVLRSKGVK